MMHTAESVTRNRSSFHPDRSGHVHRQGWGLIPVNLPVIGRQFRRPSKKERSSHRKVLGDALFYLVFGTVLGRVTRWL